MIYRTLFCMISMSFMMQGNPHAASMDDEQSHRLRTIQRGEVSPSWCPTFKVEDVISCLECCCTATIVLAKLCWKDMRRQSQGAALDSHHHDQRYEYERAVDRKDHQ